MIARHHSTLLAALLVACCLAAGVHGGRVPSSATNIGAQRVAELSSRLSPITPITLRAQPSAGHGARNATMSGGLGGGAVSAATANEHEPYRGSGYFKLNRTYDAHMFFFYFEAREKADTSPVVLWMTGGPGCSSELAVFFENGPYSLSDSLEVEETRYGWDVSHTMIFIDSPVPTGFSYTEDERDRCFDEDCVSSDVLDFLEALWLARPELQGRELFVTGESYAGHYVPAVASAVFRANNKDGSGGAVVPITLKGFAIGNGLTDPAIQYGAYADFAVMNKLITPHQRDSIAAMYPSCRLALEACDGLGWSVECILAVNYCQATMFAPIMLLNPLMNVYDIRIRCQGPLCYPQFEKMDRYLNQPEVQKALGVDKEWVACDMGVHEDMMADWGHSFDGVIPEMLAAGVRALIYAGDKDFICNWVGNRRWVDQMQWGQWREWVAAPNVTWTVEGEAAGAATEVGPLAFLRVYDAGHMVPMDQAKRSLAMITAFTRGEPLGTGDVIPPDASAVAVNNVNNANTIIKGDGGAVLRPGGKNAFA